MEYVCSMSRRISVCAGALLVLFELTTSTVVLPRPPSSLNHIHQEQELAMRKALEGKSLHGVPKNNMDRPDTEDYRYCARDSPHNVPTPPLFAAFENRPFLRYLFLLFFFLFRFFVHRKLVTIIPSPPSRCSGNSLSLVCSRVRNSNGSKWSMTTGNTRYRLLSSGMDFRSNMRRAINYLLRNGNCSLSLPRSAMHSRISI